MTDNLRELCPHCGHEWWFHSAGRCSCGGNCGCMWKPPEQPKTPINPNPLRDAIEGAIWSALRGQDIYVDEDMGTIDTSGSWTGLDMAAVADAVIDLLIDMAGKGELLRSIDGMNRD
jgi:hypothetical protein